MDFRAIIFVPALAGSVIFGFVFALFAAHYYLNVLQSTGAGAREVTWASEPIIDHFWKVFYLAWLIGLWLGPAWLLGRALAGGSDALWVKFAVPLAVFWVCYPISQLSSLSGPTIWLPLHPGVFDRLAGKPGVLPGFLVLSAAALAGVGLGFHWVFTADGFWRLVVGCPVFIVSALVYARLLGRLAFVLAFTKPFLTRRKKKKKRQEGEDPAGGAPPADADEPEPRFAQPSDLPPIETPDEGPLTGYDVKFEDAPRPRKRVVAEAVETDEPEASTGPRRVRAVADDDEDAPYAVHEPEVQPEERAPLPVVKPREDEMRLLSRDDAPRAPKRVWSREVFQFLAQPETLTVVAVLSTMCFAAGGLVRIAREFNPAE